MSTSTKQANFLLPEDLLEELRKTVPGRQQSKIVAEALRKELRRRRLKKAIQESFGAWKDKDHPELKKGSESFVRSLRKSTRMTRSR
jgi:metal-responsive CopG/Arc/MetJ family transcriptional regulator